jgi:PAS domain S-box-containing protein
MATAQTLASPRVLPQDSQRTTLADGFHLASAGLTALVAVVALWVMAGWIWSVPAWKSVFPGSVSMKPNIALCLLLSAVAMWIYQRPRWAPWRDPVLRTLAGITMLIGVLTVVEHLTGWNLRIDQLLFRDDGTGGSFGGPGRMAVSTAVSFIFLNIALIVADTPGRFAVAQMLVGGAAFLSLLNTVGYFFGVDVFEGIASYTKMSMHTSGCFLLLCTGFYFARPTAGVMTVVSDTGPSGFVVRRLLPPVFVVPVLLAWLSWRGELAGFYSPEFAMTFFVVSAITALSGVVWAGGLLLRGIEARREVAERLRQQSEENLRLAVTDAPVPMLIHDDGDQILHMSRGWSDYSGFSLAETPTISTWTSRAQGSTRFEVKAHVEKLAGAKKTIYGGESTITAKSGDRRVWDFSTTPLGPLGDHGRTFLTIAVDVTDRKRAESDLRRMNEELELRIAERTQTITQANDVLRRQSDQLKEQAALLDLVREGIIVRDLYGTIVYWSAGAVSLYGWTQEEALGQVSHKLLRCISTLPVAEIEKQVVATGIWEGEMIHTTKTGAQMVVESKWTLTRTDRGVPQGFLEVNHDITARKRADASLKDSERRFRAVADTANEGIVTADEKGVIRYWNPGAALMFGRSEDQSVGQPLTIMMPERFQAAHAAGMQHHLTSQTSSMIGRTTELVGRRKDGSEFPLEISLSSFQTSKGLFFSAILRDITERKTAERALVQKNDELGRSNQELEQFAYVASHDLQEPLRMVANYTKLLGSRYKDKLDSDGQEFVDFAVDGALRMQALIHDLLQFARVGTRGKEFKAAPVAGILEDAVANLSGAIEESKAEVVVGDMPTIKCDASQLTQVFQNLIGNALKFRKPETTPAVRVTATNADGMWTFAISDNGIGIDPKYFERIFQMFQRLHGRGEYPGTGIGLALVKKIVERHGGRITVSSEPGQGTTFAFSIPDAGAPKA